MIYEDKYNLGPSGRKAFRLYSRKDGAGINPPGKVALKFDKDILSQLAKNYEIVVITGTNGKTLTTALTVGILQEAFGPILTNPSGANMISGITTTFLRAKHSKANRPIAVLEIDEASLSRICDYIKPSLLWSLIFSGTRWTAMERSIRPTK